MAVDKFMPEMQDNPDLHIVLAKQRKNKKIKQKTKKTWDSWYIYQNKLDKACFQHEMAHRGFKDLTGWTAVDKVLLDKAFNIAKNSKHGGCQEV